MFGHFDLLQSVMTFIPMLLSLTVHEFAHAWSAYVLGDDTAARQGRMTLNPIVHIDPLGTVILPLLGIPFGWAKPVPVNPAGFRRDINMNTGMMLTALAGPLSNLVLAVICTVILALARRWAPFWLDQNQAITALLYSGIGINVTLAIFNLIPLPPLDGSRVVEWLLPYRFRDQWETVKQFGSFGVFALMYFGGAIIAGPAAFVMSLLGVLFQSLKA